MEAVVVRGGRKLEGTMRVDGAKNAALPILAASVLTEETVVLQGVPMISDVRKMTDILTMLGCRIRRDGHTLTLDAGGLNRTEMPDALSPSRFDRPSSCLGRFSRASGRRRLHIPAAAKSDCAPLICTCQACAVWAW